MEELLSNMPDISGAYYYVIVAVCVFAMLYINDAFTDIRPLSVFGQQKEETFNNYGYDDCNGPAFWKNSFPDAASKGQSPVNLRMICATILSADSQPLSWSKEYDKAPLEMMIYNTGHCVVIYTTWCGKRPTISGGPLSEDTFEFMTLRFRWGPTDEEGSEHMVDDQKYALEMQVAYVKTGFLYSDVLEVARNNGLVMISYFFMVTETDNPYMEPIVTTLRCLKYPSSCATLNGIPLSLLAPSFSRNYYCYNGSLTFPPCTEGVRWLVQAEPLLISKRQVKKFRKLYGCNMGPLVSNCRPVQMINDREMIFYS